MSEGWDPVTTREFAAGPGRLLVVHRSLDSGDEIDPFVLFGEIAADAEQRAERGQSIVSMVGLPLRHAGAAFGREGSGYETKGCVAVLYALAAPAGTGFPAEAAVAPPPEATRGAADAPEGLVPPPWA
jgi:hypothetical protein